MARGQHLHRIRAYSWPRPVLLRAQAAASHPQVGTGQRLERGAECLRPRLDLSRQSVEDTLDLSLLVEVRLGPGVVQVHDGEWLNEQRRAGRSDPPAR
jgi:hypothetical protein